MFQRAAHFWIELFEALLEHEKIAPSQSMLWDARIQRQGTRRYMAEKFILTHTHTHEMSYEMFRGHCHSRCRISWRRSRAADLRILRSKDSLEQKVVLTFRRVLANICRPVMETVPVLSFGKFGENGKKKWTKYGENLWTILVLPSSFPLVLNSKFHWNVYNIFLTCAS